MLESDELREIATSLLKLVTRAEDEAVLTPLDLLEKAASQAAKAWSGSSLGYHANVYYDDLQPPPPGAHFSQEWGLRGMFQGSTGTWREYSYEAVYQHILTTAAADLSAAEDLAAAASSAFRTARSTVDSILTLWMI
jgi:hypothetical protein